MENEQRSKLDSYQRVQDFNTKYATDLATVTEYAGIQSEFDETISAITTRSAGQQETTGVTADLLDAAKHTMAETVIQFASRGVVKAQLAAIMNWLTNWTSL
jgi:hypothetical protein